MATLTRLTRLEQSMQARYDRLYAQCVRVEQQRFSFREQHILQDRTIDTIHQRHTDGQPLTSEEADVIARHEALWKEPAMRQYIVRAYWIQWAVQRGKDERLL